MYKAMASDKIAIITGANKGLGYALVKELCKKDYGIVYLTSRDQKRGQDACEILKKSGFAHMYHHLDITDKESIKKFTNHIQEKHGKVDLLINNAGILFLKDSTEPFAYQVEQTLTVNFFSLVDFTEAMLPLLKNGSKMVNISSSSGHLSRIPSEDLRIKLKSEDLNLEDLKSLVNGYLEDVRQGRAIKDWGDSPYVVSKVAVNAYTFILHRKLHAEGISINCVHPGYVRSDMTKGAGTVTAEEGTKAPLRLALGDGSGLYLWHDGTPVLWDGPDPRGYIDGKV